MKSKLYSLSKNDFIKGAAMAVLGGLVFPIILAAQTPDFSIFTADWKTIMEVSVNGAIVAFISYIAKNFFSDEKGKLMGRV